MANEFPSYAECTEASFRLKMTNTQVKMVYLANSTYNYGLK